MLSKRYKPTEDYRRTWLQESKEEQKSYKIFRLHSDCGTATQLVRLTGLWAYPFHSLPQPFNQKGHI